MEDNPLLSRMLPDEHVVKEGKPDKGTFILKSVFSILLPFAVVWCCIDIPLLVGTLMGDEEDARFSLFLIPFLLFHMTPVWIYLGNLLFAVKRYKNSWWLVTNRTIYVSSGIFTMSVATKAIADTTNVSVLRGIIEKWRSVGSIELTGRFQSDSTTSSFMIPFIKEYDEVEMAIRQLRRESASELFNSDPLQKQDEE